MASQDPRQAPYLEIASDAYCEQLGVKRQWFPKNGLNINW
jgi:hypothetical protein